MTSSILVADQDRELRDAISQQLTPYLLRVYQADCQSAALGTLMHHAVALVVLDTGIMQLTDYREAMHRRRAPSLIVTTASPSFQMAVSALRLGAKDVFERPYSVEELTNRISSILESRVASPHYLARRLDRFLQENCTRRNLNLSRLSRSFGISQSYASLLLRDGDWRGFRSRLVHHRVKRAQHLLVNTDEPLHQIADSCGFSSASRLSETFARLVGVTPKKYRELSADARDKR